MEREALEQKRKDIIRRELTCCWDKEMSCDTFCSAFDIDFQGTGSWYCKRGQFIIEIK